MNNQTRRKINKLHARALRKVEIARQYPRKLKEFQLLDEEPSPAVIFAAKPPSKHAPTYSIRNSQPVLAFLFRSHYAETPEKPGSSGQRQEGAADAGNREDPPSVSDAGER